MFYGDIILCGYGTVFFFFLFYAFYLLSKRNNYISIFDYKPFAVQTIKRFLNSTGIAVTIGYILVLIGTYYSPYGYQLELAIYMGFLSIFPLFSYICINNFSRKILSVSRMKAIEEYEQKVLAGKYERVLLEPTEKNIKQHQQLLDYRDYIASYSPEAKNKLSIGINKIGGLILSSIPSVLQLIITVINTQKQT